MNADPLRRVKSPIKVALRRPVLRTSRDRTRGVSRCGCARDTRTRVFVCARENGAYASQVPCVRATRPRVLCFVGRFRVLIITKSIKRVNPRRDDHGRAVRLRTSGTTWPTPVRRRTVFAEKSNFMFPPTRGARQECRSCSVRNASSAPIDSVRTDNRRRRNRFRPNPCPV